MSISLLWPCNHFWQRKEPNVNRIGIAPTIFAASPHLLPPLQRHIPVYIHTWTCTYISGETELVVISTSPLRRRSKKATSELVRKMHYRFSNEQISNKDDIFKNIGNRRNNLFIIAENSNRSKAYDFYRFLN